MNSSIKIALALLAIGVCISLFALFALRFDFEKLSTETYVTNTHTVHDPFRSIRIDTDVAAIRILPAENDVCAVLCHEAEKAQHSVSVQEDTLVIGLTDSRKWYEKIGIITGKTTITVYLPAAEYGKVEAKADTGRIEADQAFTFESAEIETDTGHISWEANVKQDLSLRTDTGAIYISAKTVGGSIRAESDTGKIQLMSVHCKNATAKCGTGSVILTNTVAEEGFDIETSTGGVQLNRSDAKHIRIMTSTGGVNGTLLTEKIFYAESDTGRVTVPHSSSGGKCEITTSTGSIHVSIVE